MQRFQIQHRRGFTLVEILIVVVILGILAAIVVPQFTSAAEQSRENSMEMSIHRIRQQIEIYQSQHHGRYPDDAASFARQMTEPTDAEGNAGTQFGPYLREIPHNPFTATNDVGDGEAGTSAWYYNGATGEFRANSSATHRAF